MPKKFNVGDKVFAKVKGYPHWPARIVEDKGKKYGVIFYGTQETGNIKAEDIIYYLKNREAFLKHSKRAGYADALEQIDAAVKKDGGDGNTSQNDDSVAKITDESMDITDTSINTPKTAEKKGNKRKISSSSEEVPASVTKPTRGRKSAVSEVKESESGESTPKRAKKKTSAAKENVEENKDDEINEDSKIDIVKSELKTEPTPSKKGRGRPSTKDKSKVAANKSGDINAAENSDSKEKEEPVKVEVKETEFVSTGDNETDIVIAAEEEKPTVVDQNDQQVEEVSPPSFKPVIVTEKLLKNNVLYAEHVRKHESLYKSRPVEPRPEDAENQALPVPLPSGTVCGLKLHKTWPLPKFANEYERALYDETVARATLNHRDKLASGEVSTLDDADVFVEKLAVTADDIKEVAYKTDIESQKKRIDRLSVEGNLVALDAKIKQCLGLEIADPEAALDHLKELLKIKFDELMLKKHVHVVDMIRRLQKYIGNTKEWNMSDDDVEDFQRKAEKIRLEAEKVYNKIKEAVTIPEGSTNFWDGFLEIVSNFRKECKDLKDEQINVLCAEPNSRKAFFHQLEEISTDNVMSNGVSSSEAVLNKADEHSSSVQGWAEKSL